MPALCTHEGCAHRAMYNKIGEINPKFCPAHKTDRMINVFSSFRFPPPKQLHK